MNYYIYNTQKANGVKVIVQNLIKGFERRGITCQEVKSLANCNKNDIVIPFGVKESMEVYKKGFNPSLALLVDAISLGYKNKIKFYLKRGYIFQYDFLYSIYGYLRYSQMEKNVMAAFKNVMLVSQVDIDYLKESKASKHCNFMYVPNGAYINVETDQHVDSDDLRVGILSSWVTKQTCSESAWFIKDYFVRFAKTHPKIKLYIAGRGGLIHNFSGLNNVIVLGAVDSLSEFFSKIDVFVSANPKGCGILNRVLDTVAYKVPVIGVPGSFTGFPNSDKVFYRFDDYKSFDTLLEHLSSNPHELQEIAQNAYEYVLANNNWETIYDKFIDDILNL